MDEEELIPLSYLSQYYYCPRRAALLLVDQQWADNQFTAEGTLIHERVHQEGHEKRGPSLSLRGLWLRSLHLGLAGKADCVEMQAATDGVTVPGYEEKWRLVPVEFKHGARRDKTEYEVQLCAQAMCLEEMLGCRIAEGYLFYEADHRRQAVSLDDRLRKLVEEGASQLHAMLKAGQIPAPRRSSRCKGCSMVDICLPRMRRSGKDYLSRLLQAAQGEAP
ncbi:MAG: CRISPR-associated protein Cas4 [Chloroflexi bacterium HGW-Chloroflexi-1]|nr:MAG: CRISPR-associated protein Cas4 [Chloroflexi bacterium HGW-Chloroflexi-1]